jgi:Domain of unknown function (DUF927)
VTNERATGLRPMPKAERLLALAREEYEPHRATRWPYLLRVDDRFRFEGAERRRLLADLRAVWRERFPGEAAPPARDLSAVADDLRRLAEQAKPDQPTAEDLAAELIAAHGISAVSADRGLSLVTRLEDCPLPDGYVIPEPYLVTADGIHLVRDDGAGYGRVAWAWLFPTRVYVDPDGDHLVELAWRDGPRWVSRLIRRSVTKSGRKLVAEAGDAGLPVIEAEARQAERWLAAAEAANGQVMTRHAVARQLGWQADNKTFVTAQDAPWRVEPRYSDQAAALAAHRPCGTLVSWKEAIAAAGKYLIVQVGAYAGLASPLLEPLGLDSFTVDISGRSTRGKTITAMVALSCWADPSDRSEAMVRHEAHCYIARRAGRDERRYLWIQCLTGARKSKRENSMAENRRPCPDARGGAPGDPHDKAKVGLPEAQSPAGGIGHPSERHPKPVPASAAGWHGARCNPPRPGAMPSQGIQGDGKAA